MARRALVALFPILALLFFSISGSGAQKIYISVNGSLNSSNCGNFSTPCALEAAQAANPTSKPGALITFLFFDGEYNTSLLTRAHKNLFNISDQSVTFASVTPSASSKVIIFSSATVYEPLFRTSTAIIGHTDVRYEGLTFQNFPGLGSPTILATAILKTGLSTTFINCHWRNIFFDFIKNDNYNDLNEFGSVIDVRGYSASFTGCSFSNIRVQTVDSRTRASLLSAKLCSGFEMTNCTYQNNSVLIYGLTGDGSGIVVEAICSDPAMIYIESSTFTSNSLESTSPFKRGGVLTTISEFRFSLQALTISNCEFSNNLIRSHTAAFGGAIASIGTEAFLIAGSIFKENIIYFSNNGTDQLLSTFGGAIYAEIENTLSISNTEFSHNGIHVDASPEANNLRSSAYGGAVAVSTSKLRSTIALANVSFLQNFIEVGCGTGSASLNEADGGGALYSRGFIKFSLKDSNISLNSVSGCHRGYGGAILGELNPNAVNQWSLKNSLFSENSVVVTQVGTPLPGSEGSGGALYLRTPIPFISANLSLDSVKFLSNSVEILLPVDSPTCDPTRGSCASPLITASGGALSSPNLISINSIFGENVVTGDIALGGAVLISTPTASIIFGTNFTSNGAFTRIPAVFSKGGGLYIQRRANDCSDLNRVTIIESLFDSNVADYGPAIFSESADLDLACCPLDISNSSKIISNSSNLNSNSSNSSYVTFSNNRGISSTIMIDALNGNFSRPRLTCINGPAVFSNNSLPDCLTMPSLLKPSNGYLILTWPARSLQNISLELFDAFGERATYATSERYTQVGNDTSKSHRIISRVSTSDVLVDGPQVVLQNSEFVPTFPSEFRSVRLALNLSVEMALASLKVSLVGCPPGYSTSMQSTWPFAYVHPNWHAMACTHCPTGTYNLDGGISCFECTNERRLQGDSQTALEECVVEVKAISHQFSFRKLSGFYIPFSPNLSLADPSLLICPTPEACLEQRCDLDTDSYLGPKLGWNLTHSSCSPPCKIGYSDFLCSQCSCASKSTCYFQINTKCLSCLAKDEPEFWMWLPLVVRVVLILVLVIGVNFWTNHSILEIALTFVLFFFGLTPGSTAIFVAAVAVVRFSANSEPGSENLTPRADDGALSPGGVLKVLLFFWQTTLALNAELWNGLQEALIGGIRSSQIGTPILAFFVGTRCFYALVFPDLDPSPLAQYLISISLPSIILFVILYGRFLLQRYGCNRIKGQHHTLSLKDEALSILFFVLYANFFDIFEATLAIFDCQKQYRFEYLSSNPSVACSNSDPRYFLLSALGVFVLVVLFCLLGAMGAFLIIHYVNNGKEKATWPTWAEFWLDGYKNEFAYFEVLWSLRRVLLSCATIVGSKLISNPMALSSIISALILLWNLIVMKWDPFTNSKESYLDVLSSSLLLVTYASRSQPNPREVFPSALSWDIFLALLHVLLITATFIVYLGKRCSCSKKGLKGSVHGDPEESQHLLAQTLQASDLLAEEASS